MKTNILILMGCIILLSFHSCYGDLEGENYDQIYPENFYKNESDVNAAATTAYHRFRINTYGGGGIYSHGRGGINIFTEMCTDIMDCQWGDGGTWNMYHTHGWTAANNDQATEKYGHYKYISQFRNIMLNIEASSVSDEVKIKYVSQVRALRAWLMYLMYDLFGPVPIASDEILKGDPEQKVIIPRPSKEEYVAQMISELKLAIADLPLPKDTEWGRMDRGIANMMLLKVYMIDGQWGEAEKIARELQKPEYGYKLLDDYYDCFSLDTEKSNGENMWSIICTYDYGVNGWVTHVMTGTCPYPNANIEKWSGYRMPWAFYHTFEQGKDKRLDNIIAEYVSTKDGEIINEANPTTELVKGALPLKYMVDPGQKGDRGAIDVPIFRYSDVLLSLAECIARSKNGAPTQEAMDLINQVRGRSGLDPLKLSDYGDPQKFYDMLLLERGHELYCEGHRRTDLIRFGKYIEFNKKIPNSQTADYKVLFPIGNKFIVEGQGQVIQNTGY
ncbi:MAG: RagB/SusD family nutrient uptake outer membrane protein [Dysgonomonas sp.]